MDYELFEKQHRRKWNQMSAEEQHQEVEMLKQSGYCKLFALVVLRQKLKEII